jgi:hypothetical protein
MSDQERIAWLLAVASVFLFGAWMLGAGPRGCSVAPKQKVTPPTEAAPECEGLEIGDTRATECPLGGQKIEVCTQAGFKVAVDCVGEDPSGCTDFRSVVDTLGGFCVSCHPGYDSYAVASAKAQEYARRTQLPKDHPEHMPKGGELDDAQKKAISDWFQDGARDTCETEPPVGAFRSFDWLEEKILSDLTKLDSETRRTTRYLVTTHRRNAKASAGEAEAYDDAVSKAINSLSFERDLVTPSEVAEGIWRFDLEDLGLSEADWDTVEGADKLDVESFTSRGELLKVLTGTQKAWLHVDNFDDTVFRNSGVYHSLTDTPQTFDDLVERLDVDYVEDLTDFDALLVGLGQSPLAPHNRLLSRHDSRDGFFWVTYDTGVPDAAEKNLFQFPLLEDVGGVRDFEFVASEVIYSLPNGLLGFALFNAAGVRQDVAPVDVVRDFENPVSAEIRNAVSCFRCHRGGILPATDQIRDHVLANGAEFGTDKDLILALYRGNTETSEVIAADNESYRGVLEDLQVDGPEDPITVANDRFLTQWDLQKTAGFLFLTEDDLRVCLNGSATGRAQMGQLLSGGTVTYDQFVATLPALKADCRLFQDPLVIP